jgi:predicted MPP superfamily phosphohydrolase
MYGYIGWRLIVPAAFGAPINIILWGILVVCVMLPFLPVILRFNGIENSWIDTLSWVAYLSFGFLTIVFAFLVVRDIGWLLTIGAQKSFYLLRGLFGSDNAVADVTDPERRRFLVNSMNLGILGITGAMTGYGLYSALRKPDVVEITIPIRNLPGEFDGFRIVQITDIHVGPTIKRSFVQSVVDKVNALKPDLVALTGDLVDGSVRQLRGDVTPLSELSAPHGRYFITGNHEYYSGVKQWIDEAARLGFDVLLNEHRVIERGDSKLLLAGVTDYSGGQFGKDHVSDPAKALDGAPNGPAKILLAHQPKSIFAAARAGFDFVISGHTHGGQYFPYHFLAALVQPYVSGLHKHGDTQIYVSRGTGFWGPQIRIGAKSEITVHRLVAA